jgi:hypothetical protein
LSHSNEIGQVGSRLPIKVKNAKPEVTDRFKMAAAAMFEIQVHAIKCAITT